MWTWFTELHEVVQSALIVLSGTVITVVVTAVVARWRQANELRRAVTEARIDFMKEHGPLLARSYLRANNHLQLHCNKESISEEDRADIDRRIAETYEELMAARISVLELRPLAAAVFSERTFSAFMNFGGYLFRAQIERTAERAGKQLYEDPDAFSILLVEFRKSLRLDRLHWKVMEENDGRKALPDHRKHLT